MQSHPPRCNGRTRETYSAEAFSQQLAEGIHRLCITAFHQTAALWNAVQRILVSAQTPLKLNFNISIIPRFFAFVNIQLLYIFCAILTFFAFSAIYVACFAPIISIPATLTDPTRSLRGT